MPAAPLPVDEAARLETLRLYPALDGTREAWADEITQAVCLITGCPIAIVSIVGAEHQWFKGCMGLPVDGTPREQSFCAYAILSPEVLIVEDATRDARFADNALVTGPPGIRFYAGAPLIDVQGITLGTLCAIHTEPYQIDDRQRRALRTLASLVVDRLTSAHREEAARAAIGASRAEADELSRAKAALELELTRRDELERALDEQARARQAAERMVLQQQHALDTAGIVAVTDRAGTILHVNDNFCMISGYAREELIGRNHRLLNSGAHSKEFFKQMYAQIGRGKSWRGEICNRSKSGELYWVDTTIVPLHDAEGKIERYIALRIDITARKRAEAQLERAKHEAEHANRAKSEFLANMSHEIRTPLTAILGYADLLRDEQDAIESPEERAGAVDAIRGAGQHLLAIINDILDLSKIEAGKMEIEQVETPLLAILKDTQSLFKPRAESKGVAFCVNVETPLPERIISDPTRLRQILINLVGNAVKFTSTGSVTISARAIDQPGGQRLVIDVSDTGPGLTPENIQRLFAPFSQADSTMTRRFGGTGLGLTISRRIASMMNGSVVLHASTPGAGSCFRVELPLSAIEGSRWLTSFDVEPSGASAPSSGPAIVLQGRILLAEDGPANQRLIAHHLRRAGATVEIVADGRRALELLEQADRSADPFDLLLTDMQMPEMDGYSLARSLRERGNTIPIVALTAHAMAEDRARCIEAGCDDYASKPIDKESLVRTCARWMAKRHGPAEHRRAAA